MIPTPPFRIPPPPKRKNIWERYLESFDTKPSANKSMMIKDVYHPVPSPPPEPQEPRKVKQGGVNVYQDWGIILIIVSIFWIVVFIVKGFCS